MFIKQQELPNKHYLKSQEQKESATCSYKHMNQYPAYTNKNKTYFHARRAKKNFPTKQTATDIGHIEKMQNEMWKRKNALLHCKTQGCAKNPKKQLQIHTKKHKHDCILYNLDKEGTID